MNLMYRHKTPEAVRKQQSIVVEKGDARLRKHKHSLKDFRERGEIIEKRGKQRKSVEGERNNPIYRRVKNKWSLYRENEKTRYPECWITLVTKTFCSNFKISRQVSVNFPPSR